MSRIFVVGWELPERSPDARMEAANYRTWQLVEPLRADGHQVHLAAGRIGVDYQVVPPASSSEGLIYVPIAFSRPSWMRQLQELHDGFRPDCIVGITFLGALRATRLHTGAPLWVDIYGDQMAEMQARAHLMHSDRGIATQLQFLRQVLLAGDVFSTCSGAQRHALLGQLAMVGRLNRATFGHELVYVLPPGAGTPAKITTAGALRGKVLDAGSRLILWCGGYNTWTDVDTLYRGLELAMQGDPRLRFVSVGGALAGCASYTRFTEMVKQSRHAERFHLLGWQPVSQVPGYYGEADLGISLDAACYEAELGTRTRLVEMMQHGLPIVTTLACELSQIIRDERLGLTFPVGDWQAMGRQILALSLDDEQRRQMGERARNYAATTLSLENSAAALRNWVLHPRHAPDRCPETRSEVYSWEHSMRALVRKALWSLAGLDQ